MKLHWRTAPGNEPPQKGAIIKIWVYFSRSFTSKQKLGWNQHTSNPLPFPNLSTETHQVDVSNLHPPKKHLRLDRIPQNDGFLEKVTSATNICRYMAILGYLCWKFQWVSSFCQAKTRPLFDGFWKKPPEVYAFVMLPRWRWNTSTFQARAIFFGDTPLQVGGVGGILWKCWFFFRMWRKNYCTPPKKRNKCAQNGTLVQKELSGDMFVFQGEYILLPFTSSPEKKNNRKKSMVES